ncbi:hypothetical protein SAMN05216456_1963 [Devosia crocina]|uniref:Uncharacterized protein n=1 Tax=Devosia crocina TaxID=429728 RepID=A0A1I7NJ73_9HYPH|nr:hypothetical protein SAMN05216456_1963 [Devosia crocina]
MRIACNRNDIARAKVSRWRNWFAMPLRRYGRA